MFQGRLCIVIVWYLQTRNVMIERTQNIIKENSDACISEWYITYPDNQSYCRHMPFLEIPLMAKQVNSVCIRLKATKNRERLIFESLSGIILASSHLSNCKHIRIGHPVGSPCKAKHHFTPFSPVLCQILPNESSEVPT